MGPEIKNLRHFQHICCPQLCRGQCFPLGYRLGFVQSLCFVCFCSVDLVKNLKPITENIPIFKFSTLNDRTECDLVLPWGNLVFPIFCDRNFVGYRRAWRTLATHVRWNGQARRWRTPDDYKNWLKTIFWQSAFERFLVKWPLSLPVPFFRSRIADISLLISACQRQRIPLRINIFQIVLKNSNLAPPRLKTLLGQF